MKKITTVFAFMLLAIAFTSCDSVTSDAKKIAQLNCKALKLIKDGGSKDELKKLEDEAKVIDDKYKKKNENLSKKELKAFEKKWRRAVEDEMENCDSDDK